MDKYQGKYRLIIIETPDKTNKHYIMAKKELLNYKKEFDKLSTLIKYKISDKFYIKLYGIDGELKYRINKYKGWSKFINLIYNMPLIKNNMSLYSDYHPDTSKKGLGYKNKEIALNTIKLIKNESRIYQLQVLNTMYNRAKYHSNQTKSMRKAMKIFKLWIKEYNHRKK